MKGTLANATTCACGHANTVVCDSRPYQSTTRRRRRCTACNRRWTTLEVRVNLEPDKPKLMREAKRVKAQKRINSTQGPTA